jgi:hypothetical protein
LASVGSVFVRFAVGLSFLSAVADRFGWWGALSQPNVAWGEFDKFVGYTGKLNWFRPQAMIPLSVDHLRGPGSSRAARRDQLDLP